MDAVVAVLIMLAILIPFAIFKLWFWFWFWVAISIVFGGFELACFLATGKTLSQNFWKWREENKSKSWIILGILVISGIILILHLAL